MVFRRDDPEGPDGPAARRRRKRLAKVREVRSLAAALLTVGFFSHKLLLLAARLAGDDHPDAAALVPCLLGLAVGVDPDTMRPHTPEHLERVRRQVRAALGDQAAREADCVRRVFEDLINEAVVPAVYGP